MMVAEDIDCSPPKVQIAFDEERLQELTDREINFAQQLLKRQFEHLSGLHSTRLQDKVPNIMSSLSNRIQIIFCQSRKHWIVATTLNGTG